MEGHGCWTEISSVSVYISRQKYDNTPGKLAQLLGATVALVSIILHVAFATGMNSHRLLALKEICRRKDI